jgi:hypothetical protein
MSIFAVIAMATCWALPSAQGEDKKLDLLTKQDATGQLSGWEFYAEKDGTKIGDVWTLRDGVLTCQGTPKGYLYTSEDYKNFVLTLEWRWVPDKKPGSGGVLIRMTGAHKIWQRVWRRKSMPGRRATSGDSTVTFSKAQSNGPKRWITPSSAN